MPKTARDTWSTLFTFYGLLAGPPGFVFLLLVASALAVHLGLLGWLFLIASGVTSLIVAGHLTAPRDAAVADPRNAILRDRLKGIEAKLMEYLRFYTTNDRRELRKEVIRRDGRTCRSCGARIGRWRDVTVDCNYSGYCAGNRGRASWPGYQSARCGRWHQHRGEQSGRPTRAAFEMLEPCEGKLSRTVLRGVGGGDASLPLSHSVFKKYLDVIMLCCHAVIGNGGVG